MATTGTWGNAETTVRGWGNGGASADFYAGFQFTAPATGTVGSVKLNFDVLTAAGDVTARLYSNSSGSPGTQIGTDSDTLSIAATTEADRTFTFASPPSITNATVYWIVFVPSAAAALVSSTCTNDASYGSGRNNTITSLTATGLPSSEDWRCEVTYTAATFAMPMFRRPTRFFTRRF